MYSVAMVPTGQVTAPPAFVRLAAHPLRWQLLTTLADGDLRVRELVSLLGEPQSLLSYHLRQLRDEGLVTARQSSHDGRDSYYHLDLDRCADAVAEAAAGLHPALGRADEPSRGSGDRKRPRHGAVLFVCTGNSARSPVAEALLRHHAGDRVRVASAGTRPRAELHPDVRRVLGEQFGIDLGDQKPRHLDTVASRRFDRVVTLCDKAREACPDFAHHPRRTHWSIPDPAAGRASYRAFQQMAAEIDTRVRHLLPTLSTTKH
jgi:ArsR family transcriptional regulator, arsenate/arsenite/antimonite-responsive transcriptional repressor / arsenate reductase (thioredoxin)